MRFCSRLLAHTRTHILCLWIISIHHFHWLYFKLNLLSFYIDVGQQQSEKNVNVPSFNIYPHYIICMRAMEIFEFLL